MIVKKQYKCDEHRMVNEICHSAGILGFDCEVIEVIYGWIVNVFVDTESE